MKIHFPELEAKTRYKILASLITPRPIAWITSVSENGVINLAPYSFFNIMGVRPPMVVFAPGNKADGEPKDTARNIIQSKEFVVHLVEENLVEQMVESAKGHAEDRSEVEATDLHTISSTHISCPRLKEARVAFECKLIETIYHGENRLVIGEVLTAHLADGILDPENYNLITEDFFPLGRLGSPDNYCRTSDIFQKS